METTDGSQPPTRLRATPSWLLTQTAAHAARLVTEGLGRIDARGYHYRLLAALEEYGPASQAELGRRCGIDRSDVVAALNELAARDLVRRSPDPTDRRRNIVTMTAAGERELHRIAHTLTRIQDDLLAPLTPTERDQLSRLLTRVLHHHSRP
ncbi:MarR family winged helix-turn-helix transcriptional regulator [Micromonospora psammae]|uniref:MarR family winged helix-turn-helix transcriptional regulator n=1 Tax=Micromonospora sp. CPCC 205556 TaxID=3122398 RepID=UPI002FF09EDD